MVQDPDQGFRSWAKENDPSGLERVNVSDTERWVSALTGGALAAIGLRQRSVGGALLGATGGYLLYRGLRGHCVAYDALGINTAPATRPYAVSQHQGIHVEESVVINESPDALYEFWRRFENLPKFMGHLESVKTLPNGTSRWTAKGPAGLNIGWDAEIVGDMRGEMISWRSLPHSTVANAGAVRFEEVPGGTKVSVSLTYNPPAGKLGAAVARLFGEAPSMQIRDDLERLKTQREGTSSAEVTEALDETFPASDPPAYTSGTATEKS